MFFTDVRPMAGDDHARHDMHPVAAGLLGAVVSGAPSTVVAVVRGEDVLAATRAAGTLLGRPTLTRAAVAHIVISVGWATVLAGVVPQRHRVAWGAAAGLAIAVLDLELIGRRFPAVRALSPMPQYLDHLAFGVVVAAALDAR